MSGASLLKDRRGSISSLPNTPITRQGLLALFLAYVFFSALVAVSSISEHFKNRGIWRDWEPSGDMYFWCEQDQTANLIREPSNAWSDFSFFLVGLVMLYYAISDMFFLNSPTNSKNMLMDHPVLSFVSAAVNIVHAIGTFANHACRCWPAYQLDVTGMYLVLMFPCVINLLHIHRNKNRSVDASPSLSHRASPTSTDPLAIVIALALYFGLAFLLFLSTYIIEDPGLLVVLILTVMTTSFLQRWRHEPGVPRYPFLLAMALGFLALGYLSWLADRLRLVCSPTSPFQLHALWHISTAVSLLVVYLHHRSEGHICLKSIFLDEKSHFG